MNPDELEALQKALEEEGRGTTAKEEAEEKAWNFLASVVDDPTVFLKLKKGEPAELTGSEGGTYYLYPSGQIVKIAPDMPQIGEMQESGGLPKPDVLASAYLWITKNEKGFLENWGCGKISVYSEDTHGTVYRQRMREAVLQGLIEDARRFSVISRNHLENVAAQRRVQDQLYDLSFSRPKKLKLKTFRNLSVAVSSAFLITEFAVADLLMGIGVTPSIAWMSGLITFTCLMYKVVTNIWR